METAAALAIRGETVSLVWHGGPSALNAITEHNRTVYRIVSRNGGKTFGPEEQIGDPSLGACLCCELSAVYDRHDRLQVAYRSAVRTKGRHMQLVTAIVDGDDKRNQTMLIHPWEIAACPVTTSALAIDPSGELRLVHETKGLLYRTTPGDRRGPVLVRQPAPGNIQKHPAIAISRSGQTLITWSEGSGLTSSGTLKWQLLDAAGNPVPSAVNMSAPRVRPRTVPAVAVLPKSAFLVVY